MMVSLGGEDECVVTTQGERDHVRLNELEERLNQHLNSVNNPHRTDAPQTGAVTTHQMWRFYNRQMKLHEESAKWHIVTSGLWLVFTVGLVIHFATEPARDWPMLVVSVLALVITYGGFSARADSHRAQAAACRIERDSLPTPSSALLG